MKISQFDKPTIATIRQAMDNALEQVASEYGIAIKTGNATFSGNEVSFKVKANTLDSSGLANTQEADNFELYKDAIGLGYLSVGDKISLQGKSFKLVGYNTRASKAPIQIQDTQGRRYKCSVKMLKVYNRNPKEA